jgi:hypothetical protein
MEDRMQRKGLDKMPYGVVSAEVVARLAFGCDFENSSAFEQSRLALWWSRLGWARRLSVTLRRMIRPAS